MNERTGVALRSRGSSCTEPVRLPEECSYLYDKPATRPRARGSIGARSSPGAPIRRTRAHRFLYQNETKVVAPGPTAKVTRSTTLGVTQIGFITAEGEFYRFDKYGHLGEEGLRGQDRVTGLKISSVSRSPTSRLEEIDPYK